VTKSSDLADLIKTREELKQLTDDLWKVRESIFKTDIDAVEETLSKDLNMEMAAIVRDAWQKNAHKETVIEQLIDSLNHLDIVRITLAMKPSETLVAKVSEWLRAETGTKVILDIKVNEDIMGGIVIDYQGKYGDYSARTKVADFLKKNPHKIAEWIKQ